MDGATAGVGGIITIKIPTDERGRGSYFGVRIQGDLVCCYGRKIKVVLSFTRSDSSFTAISTRFLNSTGEGLTPISSSIDVPNGKATFIFSVDADAKTSASSYMATCLSITNNYAVSADTTITITAAEYSFLFEDTEDAILFDNPCAGMMMSAMGHSMVQQDRWQRVVKNDLRLSSYANTAIYGGTLVDHYTDVSNISTDSDIIVIWYDTNDWNGNKVLGNIDDVPGDTVTFCGAMNYVCKWIAENVPTARVVLVCSPKRMDGTGHNPYVENSNGDTLEDFANAIGQIAKVYGYSVCDLFHEFRCNQYNYLTYLDNDALHPSVYGAGQMAKWIENSILGC